MQIRVGIIGGAGYTGGELIRLLINHPSATIAFVHSRSNAGKPIHSVHADLVGETDLDFSDKVLGDVEVLFLCAGHKEAIKFLSENEIDEKIKLVDLSHDFRLHASSSQSQVSKKNNKTVTRNFVYGLPEINKEKIKKASYVANPGCFATAIMLGLLPLAKAGLLTEVHTTGITGSTGAGQGLSATSHFSWRTNNIQAYKTLEHQHLNEIHESLHQLQQTFPGSPVEGGLNFIPWRGDFSRGIFISSQISCAESETEILKLYKDYYSDHPFVYTSKEAIFLKQVVNTNKCVIQPEKIGTKLIIHSALDNLLKGASGQALQNMNLMFGLDETTGLKLKASAF